MRIAMAGLLSVLWSSSAVPCSCENLVTEAQIDRAAYVFRARVTEAELVQAEVEEAEGLTREHIRARVDILSVLKGDPASLDGILTPSEGPACGIPIVIGLDYVFFLTEAGVASLCGGTLAKGRSFGNTSNWVEFVKRYGLAPELY